MKCRILLSLLAVCVMAVGMSVAQAATSIQLNLQYVNPNDESEGGTWELLAKTDNAAGISGISVDVAGINNDAAVAGVSSGGAYEVFQSGDFSGIINVVSGDDLTSVVNGVGNTIGLSADDLFPGNSPTWDNSSLFASGGFGATRPVIQATTSANEFDVNDGSTAVSVVVPTFSVRGDGVATDGLLQGDANRSGVVNSADLALLLASFNSTSATWNNGNFNSTVGGPDTNVNSADLALLLANFNGTSATPLVAGLGAVPEPTSAVLMLLAAAGFGCVSRRRK